MRSLLFFSGASPGSNFSLDADASVNNNGYAGEILM